MPEKKNFLLRLDPDLWDALQAWAAADLRSVNGQIEWALRQALAARGRGAGEAEGGEGKGKGRPAKSR